MNHLPVQPGLRLAAGLFLALLPPLVSYRALAQSPFPDVPPCHWAAAPVDELAGTTERNVDEARNSAYLARNAVQQVFEGLRCKSPEWSLNFLTNAPMDWPEGVALQSFELRIEELQLSGDSGEARVAVEITRKGTASSGAGNVQLSFVNGRWLVAYDSLRDLDLDIFP